MFLLLKFLLLLHPTSQKLLIFQGGAFDCCIEFCLMALPTYLDAPKPQGSEIVISFLIYYFQVKNIQDDHCIGLIILFF